MLAHLVQDRRALPFTVVTMALSLPLTPIVHACDDACEMMVFAGAGFRLPIEEAAAAFTAEEGVRVDVTFAGSGCLLAQAEMTGKGDVFIPGEVHYLDQAIERGLADAAVSIAYLQPVIAVPSGNPLDIHDLVDLAEPGVRVGLGDPTSVAVGVASERWLESELDEATRARLDANVRTRAINVNELGSQLALGALDAAIVWDVTVELFPTLDAVAPASGRPFRTIITGGVLGCSREPLAAGRFLEFLTSEAGAAIFRRHGYEPVSAESDQLASETP